MKRIKVNIKNSNAYYDKSNFIVSYFWIFDSAFNAGKILEFCIEAFFELCPKISYLQCFNTQI